MEKKFKQSLKFSKKKWGQSKLAEKNVKKVLTNSENFKQSLRFPKKKGEQFKLAKKC